MRKFLYIIKNDEGTERTSTYDYNLARHFAKQVRIQEGIAHIEVLDLQGKYLREEIIK